jgi:hypothetical protein
MKISSVAQVRASLASLLARREVVVIARYGKPIGLLIGLAESNLLEGIDDMTQAELWSRLDKAGLFSCPPDRDRAAPRGPKKRRPRT